jgi:ubiquinone biosynthesis protein
MVDATFIEDILSDTSLPVSNGSPTTGYTFQEALRSTEVSVNPIKAFFRLLRILFRLAIFGLWWLLHKVTHRDKEERERANALKFKDMINQLSGVLIKVGQQLSQRPDLVSPAYCDALRDFLEEVKDEIPAEDIEAAIKRQTGKSVDEAFAYFNWDAVGKASVACVYKAVLHSGEEVAVKIRRPRLDKVFAADLKAIDWTLHLIEFLTIWRPGMTKNFRLELRALLTEELDFKKEARYQELFRRYHNRRKKWKVTAPKVYYNYCGREVMVSEYIHGIRVSQILQALDEGNELFLGQLSELGIEPKTIAKRLVRSRYYSFHECPLFHGDPHPANILIQPNNRIVMIDFGACGVFSQRDRNLMWQLNQYYAREDVANMVNMVIGIMEPVDPVRGIHQFKKDLIDAWWTGFYGIKSNHAEWWERSSFWLWLRFFQLIRKHQVPIPRNVVRMIRATLLYDTVAARLNPKINVFKEFHKYSRGVAKRTRRHIEKCAVRQMLLGPDDENFLKAQQVADVSNGLLFRLQRFLDDPGFNFMSIAGKVYSAVRALVRAFLLAGAGAAVTAVTVAILYATGRVRTDARWNPFTSVGSYNAVQMLILVLFLVVAGLLVVYGRRIYLRFGDVDD